MFEKIKSFKYSLFIVFCFAFLLAGCSCDSLTESTTHSDKISVQALEYTATESIMDLEFIPEGQNCSGAVSCWFNDADSLYYVFLPSFSGLETTKISSVNGIIINANYYESGASLSGLSLNKPYQIMCFSENGSYSDTGNVIFMQSENISAMFIETESGTIDDILADKNYKEDAQMTLIDSDGVSEYESSLDYIKGRGNYTWTLDKRSFNIKLDEASDLLGMGSAKRWCLLANYTDQSFIRNKLAYDLAKNVGIPFSVDSEYIDLYLNGEYYGLFLLTEKVELNENRIDLTDLEKATENINLDSLDFFEPFEITDDTDIVEKGVNIESDPEDITGGYLFELDFDYSYEVEPSGFMSNNGIYCVLKSPEYASKAQVNYIRTLFQKLENGIVSNNSETYLQYLDLDSWVNVYLVSEIFENYDTMQTSQFFYKDADSNGTVSKIFAGPIWDFDVTMGNIVSYTENPRTLYVRYRTWFEDLYAKKSFYDRVVELYESTYVPLLNEMLNTGIDEYISEISTSAAMNYVRWPLPDSATSWDNLLLDSLSENADYIKNYLAERIDFLTDLWINDEDYVVVIYHQLDYSPMLYMFKKGDTLDTIYEPNIPGYIFNGWYYRDTTVEFDPSKPLTTDIELDASFTQTTDLTEQQLDALGYDLKTCPDIYCYLKLLQYSDYTVFISANDEATVSLDEYIIAELSALGLSTDLTEQTGISYLAVIENDSVIADQSGYKLLSKAGTLNNGAQYQISSAAGDSGNNSSIIIDDTEYAVNSRGLNFVVYDETTYTVVDSVCFDTYLDLSINR